MIAGLAFFAPDFWIQNALYGGFIVFAGMGMIVMGSVLLTSAGFSQWVSRFLRQLSAGKIAIEIAVKKYHAGKMIAVFCLSLLGNAFSFISCYFLARSVGIDVSFFTVSGTVAIAGLLNLLPVTVMGLGTRELVFLKLLAGLPHAQILAFSGLMLFVAQIGGALIAMILGHSILLGLKIQRTDSVAKTL